MFLSIAFMMQGPDFEYDPETIKELVSFSQAVDLINMFSGITILGWGLWVNIQLKVRQVTQIEKLLTVFPWLLFCNLMLLGLSLYLSITFLYKYSDKEPDQRPFHKLLMAFFIGKGIEILLLLTSWVLFWFQTKHVLALMIKFHDFLNNYRLTPKSRFIRKYQPNLDPLYEEMSNFEASNFSTTERGTSLVHSGTKERLKSQSSNQFSVSAHQQMSSMMLKSSAIMYDEVNNTF